jgi:hypothetical protein
MLWFKKTPAPVAEPFITPELQLAEAYAAWKHAEVVLTDACSALNRFRLTHPAHVPIKRIGDQIYVQLTPNDSELIALSSAENHARIDRDNKLDVWSKLKEKLDQSNGKESVHVAGVLVR